MHTMTRVVAAAACSLLFATPLFAAETAPTQVDGAVTVDTDKARSLFEQEVAFVDVRKDSDFDAGRIPGAIHIELKKKFDEESLSSEVKKNEPVVFYCNGQSCMRSSNATKLAVGWGFTKVHYYRDGFPAWKAAGNPVE